MLTSLLLDIFIVLILLLTAYAGYRKGFLRYIIGTLGTIIVIVAAYLATGIFAPMVYDSYVQPLVIENINKQVDTIDITEIVSDEIKKSGIDVDISNKELNNLLKNDNDISKEISKAANDNGISSKQSEQLEKKLDDFFENNFLSKFESVFDKLNVSQINKNLDYNKNMAFDTVRAMAKGDNKLAAQYLEQNIVRGFVMSLLKIVMFIVLFIVFSFLLRIVLKITCILDHIPIANGANKFFGILIGLFKGLIIVLIVALAVHLLIDSSGNSLNRINTEIIDKTYIFKHLYDFIGDWQ